MKKNTLINLLAVIFLVSHFFVVLLVLYFRFFGGYDTEKVKISLPIILPLFATHSIVIVSYIVRNATTAAAADEPRYNWIFVFLALFIPLLFVLFTIAILVKENSDPFTNDDFAYYLGLSETIFGVFIGVLIRTIYGGRRLRR
jgi:hypothetical protein